MLLLLATVAQASTLYVAILNPQEVAEREHPILARLAGVVGYDVERKLLEEVRAAAEAEIRAELPAAIVEVISIGEEQSSLEWSTTAETPELGRPVLKIEIHEWTAPEGKPFLRRMANGRNAMVHAAVMDAVRDRLEDAGAEVATATTAD